MYVILCDGSSQQDGQQASVGIVIWERLGGKNGQRVSPTHKISKHIGAGTNNDAEWTAILTALEWVAERQATDSIFIYSDSQLAVFQATGKYGCNQQAMKDYKARYDALVKKLRARGQEVNLAWVPRQLTHLADKQADRAMKVTGEGAV